MIKGLLFDLDGTIWDSEGTIFRTILEAISEAGINAKDEEILKKFEQYRFPAKVLRVYGVSEDLFWRNYRKNYMNIPLFFDNTSDVFDKLLKSQRCIGFITSLRKKFALGLLKKFDLGKYCQVLITPSECRTTKPSPRPIIMALSKLAIENNQAIYIGDQDSDVIAARRAGCKSGLAAWNRSVSISEKPDYIFTSFDDLLLIKR